MPLSDFDKTLKCFNFSISESNNLIAYVSPIPFLVAVISLHRYFESFGIIIYFAT